MRIGIPVRVENDLRERTLAADPVDDFHSAVAATWRDFDFAHRGGESNRAAQSRITSILVKILKGCRGQRVVVGTHGNVLALYLNHLDPTVGIDFWASLKMPDAWVVSDPLAARPTYRRLDF
jgi:2,3-bisphosphoglycerate-dependent phosphoglycerate mutase